MTGPRRALALTLGAARAGLGTAIWLIPGTSLPMLGLDPRSPEVVALARLAGTRDLALGALAIATAGGDSAATVARLNATVDALDAVALTQAGRNPGLRRAGLLGATSAVAAAALGTWLAAQLDREKAHSKSQ